jgi:large subunit ribosomal protein L5
MLKEQFEKEILKTLQDKLQVKNRFQVPRFQKIVVNVGIGTLMNSTKDYSYVEKSLVQITGQKPIVRKSKKAISNFKLRIGMPVSLQVTLRGKRMYDFYERLVNIALPRIRDFRGLSRKAFDKNANYNIGLKEHVMFPEIGADDINKIFGMQITIVTSAKKKEDAQLLLETTGFPFRKEEK